MHAIGKPFVGSKLFNPTSLMMEVVFGLWLIALPLWAQEHPAQSQPIPMQSRYKEEPAKPGDRCIVCGAPLTAETGVRLTVRGRRVPVSKALVDTFLSHPEKYFAKMQPKGALFQEEMSAPAGAALSGISLGWFLFGLYILAALVFAGLSGYAAVSKGLRPIQYFFIGFFLSAFGYLYVLTRSAAVKKGEIPVGLVKVPTTAAPRPCPACGYANHPSAKKCVGCGGKLEPMMVPEVARV